MQALKTQINPQSSEFRANADTVRALVEDLRTKVTDVAHGGAEAARACATSTLRPSCRRDALKTNLNTKSQLTYCII